MDAPIRFSASAKGPFKAAQSYGPADDLLFHGRDADGASLAQFLADRPFAVLTAPSGAGKTSLLQAKAMPLLESERWFTVYARPHGNPDEALREALCAHLLPSMDDEAAVVERLIAAAPGGAASTLADAFAWYGGLPVEDRAGHRHFSPEAAESEPLPMLSRTLRGTITLSDLIEHFEAVVADGPALGITPRTRLDALVAKLGAPSTRAFWEAWCTRFHDGSGLADALAVFQDEWAPLRPGVSGVVIVLDQVEELFTQFPAGTVEQFLAETANWFLPWGSAESRRPLNLTLALRKEFFADIVPHLHAFGSIERLAYFLNPMTADQARDALAKPAKLFGVEFEPPATEAPDDAGCLIKVLSLAVEDGSTFNQEDFRRPATQAASAPYPSGRYAPALISLIGAHLWAKLRAADPPVRMPLSWAAFQALIPQLDDVFTRFLEDALGFFGDAGSGDGKATRFDALELLDHLVTSTGYRNIVAEVQLIDQLPLPHADAAKLLEDMDRHLKLVRRESRGRSRFVEITHERLIAPVRRLLAELRRQDVLRAALAPAHDMIHMLPDDPDPTRDPLPSPHLREALVRHRRRSNLDRLAVRHLLRSVLCAGPDREGTGADDVALPGPWKSTVVALAAQLDDRSRDDSGRLPFLSDSELDPAIDALLSGRDGLDGAGLRHLAMSVLADRTDMAGPRIHRMLGALRIQGYRL